MGKFDHFIPCLLLSRFSADGARGRKAQVFQIRSDGPHPPKAVAAESLAGTDHFYRHDDFPDLDQAGLHSREHEAAQVLDAVDGGVAPQVHASILQRLVPIQAMRTRAFRQGLTDAGEIMASSVGSFLTSEKGRQNIDSLVRHVLHGASREEMEGHGFDSAAIDLVFQLRGVPEMLDHGLEAARSTIAPLVLALTEALSRLDVAPVAQRAQIQGLYGMVSCDAMHERFARARWDCLVSDEPLILGDACVVVVGASGVRGWLAKLGNTWAEAYLPINPKCAIVALADDAPLTSPSLTGTELNVASAALSRQYIYASQCTELERELSRRIGSEIPMIGAPEADRIVDDLSDGLEP